MAGSMNLTGVAGVADPVRSTVQLSGTEVSYLEWGRTNTAGRQILLLHGGGLDNAWLSWAPLGATLAEAGYHVIAPDHPGYGHSPLPHWPSTQTNLIAHVDELVSALDLQDYVIGGLSLGGGLTLGHLLGRKTGAVAAMLFGSYGLMDHQAQGPFAVPCHVGSWLAVRSGWLAGWTRLTGHNRTMLALGLRNILLNPDERTPELIDALEVEAGRPTSYRAYEQWQVDQMEPDRMRCNYLDQLGSITCPVLVVHGGRDLGVPVAQARAAAERLPHGQLLEIPDAGHWVQRDRPGVVAPAVVSFLDELSQATAGDVQVA